MICMCLGCTCTVYILLDVAINHKQHDSETSYFRTFKNWANMFSVVECFVHTCKRGPKYNVHVSVSV